MMKGKVILFLVLCGAVCSAAPVEVDFFFELGCHECERIEAKLLPEVEEQFGEACVVRSHDVGIETNFLYLLQLENAIGHMGPDRAYLIVNKQFLFGPNPSHEEFLSLISELVGQGCHSLKSLNHNNEVSLPQVESPTERLCPPHAPEYGKRVLQSDSVDGAMLTDQ